MAKNYVEKGDNPEVVAPEALDSGEFFVVGALAGVAAKDADSGEGVAMGRTGAWGLPKATGVTFVQGDLAYWDVADKNFNDDTANNALAIVLEDAGSSDTTFVGILLPLPIAGIAAAAARLDTAEGLDQTMPATGTQKAMSASDTYVNFTEDLLEWAADAIEAGNVLKGEFLFKVDGMNAAGSTTFGLLLGSLDLGTVVVSTADTDDYARIGFAITFKTVGASSTVDVVLTKVGSDGGTVTITELATFAATGPATTAAVQIKGRAKTATGNAANLVTQHSAFGRLYKKAA